MNESMERGGQPQISRIPLRIAAAILLLVVSVACSAPAQNGPTVGDEFEIRQRYETSDRGRDGSSGSSSGRSALLERVLAERDGGAELEFDLPRAATTQDRARQWQFPARVFRAADGSMQLLNRAELESRVDGWLEAGGFTREACGKWIFTWDAFLIDCDPASVLATVAAFDLRLAGLREGAVYRDADASEPGTLRKLSGGDDGATFAVELAIDTDAVRRARAASDVAVGQMQGRPDTLEAALAARENDRFSGTISITLDIDAAGNLWRRTKVTTIETTGADGRSETHTVTETIERRAAEDLPARTATN